MNDSNLFDFRLDRRLLQCGYGKHCKTVVSRRATNVGGDGQCGLVAAYRAERLTLAVMANVDLLLLPSFDSVCC